MTNQRLGRAELFLTRAWQQRGWLAWSLWPFSLVFGAIAALRRASFRAGLRKTERIGLPVVVVGNVTVGGTGKTPTVIALARALREAGFTPGVISRGYGVKVGAPREVRANSAASEVGDEPLLIARRSGAPVVIHADRVAAAQALRRAHPEVDAIISDDGLQHYQLGRDAEVVVFDHRLGGNGFLLPAGPLRESLSRARDATLVNNPYDRALPAWPDTFSLRLEPGEAWHVANPSLRRPLAQFARQRVLAAAGIGAPERFFATLRAQGITPATRALPDHYRFETNPFGEDDAEAVLITEKDAVKCTAWRDDRLWAVPVEAVLDPRLIALVVEKLRGRTPA